MPRYPAKKVNRELLLEVFPDAKRAGTNPFGHEVFRVTPLLFAALDDSHTRICTPEFRHPARRFSRIGCRLAHSCDIANLHLYVPIAEALRKAFLLDAERPEEPKFLEPKYSEKELEEIRKARERRAIRLGTRTRRPPT